ncbi:MAG: hypothetical protein MJA29_08275, partial [Candidatus Omnitrophica bacterium]|nr:hypothetical protein [Candidatus Omnitrophota bacterium]
VNVTDPNGVVVTQTALEFTENQDNLLGTTGDDIFTATSLDQIEDADNADGNGGDDTLLVDFAVNNGNRTLESLLDNANIVDIDEIEFNTPNDVSFQANRTGFGTDTTPGGDFDFDIFTLGSGDDTIFFGGSEVTDYTVNGNGGDDVVQDNFDWTGDGFVDGADTDISFNGGAGDDNFVFNTDAMMTALDSYAPGEGDDTVTINDQLAVPVGVVLTPGEIAALVTDGALENVVVNSGDDIDAEANNADLYDFTGQVANYDLAAADDIFFSAVAVNDQTEAVDVTVSAGGDILIVGGSGNDTITVVSGDGSGVAGDLAVAADAPGIIGLRGGDTINLDTTSNPDYVVYRTPQDGALEGLDGGAGLNDTVNNFEVGIDTFVFALAGGLWATPAETGTGTIGDVAAAKGGAPVTNPAAVDVDVDGLALFTGTTLTDADLLNLDMVGAYVASSTALQGSVGGVNIGDTQIFAVHGINDTAVYSFTADNADADITRDELSLMSVVDSALLTVADFAVL